MNQFQFNLESLFKHQITNNEPQLQMVNDRYIYYNEYKNLKRLDLIDFTISIICELVVPIQSYSVNHSKGTAYIGHSNGEFSIIDIIKKKINKSYKIFETSVNIFDINQQYQIGIFGNTQGILQSLKIQTGDIANKIDSQQKKITQIKVLRNMVLTAGLQTIVCRDLYLNQQIWNIKQHDNFITKIMLDEQSKQVFSGQFHGKLLVTSLENQESFQLNTKDSFEFAKMNDDHLIVSELNSLTFWDLQSRKKIQEIKSKDFVNRIVYCKKTDLIVVVKSNYILEIYQIQRVLDSQSESLVSNSQLVQMHKALKNGESTSQKKEQRSIDKKYEEMVQNYDNLQQKYKEQQEKLEKLKKYEFLEELESFKGIILNGEKYGVCKETYKNGNIFLGNYQKNFKNGPGELQIGSKIIQGNFINNYIRGDIVIEDQDTKTIIEGNCEIFKDLNSSIKINSIISNGLKKEVIEGKFIDQKIEGYGCITFSNNYQIIGNFKDDKLQIDSEAKLMDNNSNQKYIIIQQQNNILKTQQHEYNIDLEQGILILLEQLINF